MIAPQIHTHPVIITCMMSITMIHAESGEVNMLNAVMDGVGMNYFNVVAISDNKGGGKEDVLAAVATLILISGQTLVVYVQQDGTATEKTQLITEDVLLEIVLNL